jgi:hypothetical protein
VVIYCFAGVFSALSPYAGVSVTTGVQEWSFLLPNEETEVVATVGTNGLVYYGSLSGDIIAARPEPGTKLAKLVWRVPVPRGIVTAPLALGSDNTVYVACSGGFAVAVCVSSAVQHLDTNGLCLSFSFSCSYSFSFSVAQMAKLLP